MVRGIEYSPDLKAVCFTELYENSIRGVARFAFGDIAEEKLYVIEPSVLSRSGELSQDQKRALFPFTTVCAILDKKHFEKFPFDNKIAYGEDLWWAVENSNKGFKLACSSFAKVIHKPHPNQDRKYKRLVQDVFGR
jgi:hypothetical protein